MTFRGRVKNGVVVLDDPVGLGEGTVVRVEPVGTSDDDGAPDGLSPLFRAPERAKKTGIADLAINHDHYLYGHPKVSDG